MGDTARVDAGNKMSPGSFASSISLAMVAISVVSFCLARRLTSVRDVRNLALARWLILAVFFDSWLFVLSSTILQASFGLNSSHQACDTGILLCLVCYLSSKVLLYFFLVEKVHVIRGNNDSRWKDKLFVFNCFGMMLPYLVIIVLTFIYRNAVITEDGECKIGLKLPANIPLLIFDFVINVYLTYLFLRPLHGLYTFNNGAKTKQARLHQVALRTFIGSCLTLISTLGNLVSLIILRGREPGWVCFAVCNSDILFSVLVLHWVTHQDEMVSGTSRCHVCLRTVVDQYGQSSISHGSAFRDLNLEKRMPCSGQVITQIEAGSSTCRHPGSIPLDGIMTHTEFTRDVESIGASETEVADRNNSTDYIREGDK